MTRFLDANRSQLRWKTLGGGAHSFNGFDE
jgi:hypothetical protein